MNKMMDSMSTPLALFAGKDEIRLFGDGSYQELISFGSWAFYAPEFGLQNAGVERGRTIEHLRSPLH